MRDYVTSEHRNSDQTASGRALLFQSKANRRGVARIGYLLIGHLRSATDMKPCFPTDSKSPAIAKRPSFPGNRSTMSNKNHKSKAKTISRNGISDRSVESLADAIAADGLTIPLLVMDEGNRNVVVAGHRRFAAMHRLIRGNRQVDLFQ